MSLVLLVKLLVVVNVLSAENSSLDLKKFEINSGKNNEEKIFSSEAVGKAFELAEIFEVNLLRDNSSKVYELTETFVKFVSEKIKVYINDLSISQLKFTKTFSTFVILENSDYLESKILNKFRSENFNFQGNVLLLFADQEGLDLEKIFSAFQRLRIFNVNILTTQNDSASLFTFMPYSTNECGSAKPIKINTFINSSWISLEIFPNKFKNLYKCPLKLSTFDYPPAIIAGNSVTGHDIELLQGISVMMNFTLNIEIVNEIAPWGFILENGTSGGTIKKIMNNEADVGIGTYYLTQTRAKFMSYSQYGNSKIILVIPPGVPLTPFEKLFSPFSLKSWIVLFVTFVIAVLVIFIIRLQNKRIQRFVFGETGNPYINLLNILMNGSQTLVPKRNFARTLLLLFIIFCIVIRTMYQAALFKFLQTDQRRPAIQTIDELIAKNYDIYMYDSFQELSNGLKIHQSRRLVGNKSIEYYQMQTLNPLFKGATVGPLSEVIYANIQNSKNFTFQVLPEILFAIPVAMYFPKNHHLVNEFSSRISILHSAGLIDRWEKKYLSLNKRQTSSTVPKKLNVGHVTGMLYIYSAGCILGMICFLLENIAQSAKSLKKLNVHKT